MRLPHYQQQIEIAPFKPFRACVVVIDCIACHWSFIAGANMASDAVEWILRKTEDDRTIAIAVPFGQRFPPADSIPDVLESPPEWAFDNV